MGTGMEGEEGVRGMELAPALVFLLCPFQSLTVFSHVLPLLSNLHGSFSTLSSLQILFLPLRTNIGKVICLDLTFFSLTVSMFSLLKVTELFLDIPS